MDNQPVPDFDLDLPHDHPVNVAAAQSQGLAWDAKRDAFLDEDGAIVQGKFGQSL